MLIGEYVQQFEPGINDANNTANSALVQSREALDQAKNATAIANEALGQSRASVIELINSVNASTVTLIGNKNDGSQTTTNLPVASELQAGVMNTATYVNLKDLNSRVTSLESNTTTYIVVLPNDTPTQAEILNAYRTAYPLAPNPPLDGTTVIDVDKQLFYRYVKNGDIWIKTSGFNVTPFTNENAGIIKGSTTPGQVQAETDGTGSLVGYDTLVSNIAQNTTAIGTANSRIDAIETKNTEQDTAINNAQTSANNAFAGASISKNANNQILNLSRGAGAGVNLPIDPVDTQHAGLVTPAMFNQWNKLNNGFPMKSICSSLQNKDYYSFQVLNNGAFVELFRIGNNYPNAGVAIQIFEVWPGASDQRAGFMAYNSNNSASKYMVKLNLTRDQVLTGELFEFDVFIGNLWDNRDSDGSHINIGVINNIDTTLDQYLSQIYVTMPATDDIKAVLVRQSA